MVERKGRKPSAYELYRDRNKFEQVTRKIIHKYSKIGTQPVTIIHGARSINAQVPKRYQRKTGDWDLKSKKPDWVQDKIEDDIDRLMGYDAVQEEDMKITGSNAKLRRLNSAFDKDGVADIMPFGAGKHPYKGVKGVRYSTLAYEKAKKEKMLSDYKFKYRWAKAKYDLERIKRFQKRRRY